MCRQAIDVDDGQAMGGEDPAQGEHREVREVLVVDRVELVVGQEPEQVRHLDREEAVVGEQDREATDEVVDVGHLGQDVIADEQVGAASGGRELPREGSPEEPCDRRDALALGNPGDVQRRLDPKCWDSARNEVAEEIAIVASHLDDKALRGQAAPAHHLSREL